MADVHPLRAALRYLAVIFTLAFAFGAFRVNWLAPRIGALSAVLIELPIILTASWLTARRIMPRCGVRTGSTALAMGALAFALLIALECALAVLAFGQSAAEWAASLATPPGLLGLIGQLGFALMPRAVLRRN